MHPMKPYSAAGHRRRTSFECVFLTCSEEDSRAVSHLLAPAGVHILPAAMLEQAHRLLAATDSAVLLTGTSFLNGTWEDALAMVEKFHPHTAVVLAAGWADEGFWIDVLERGVFDLVLKPFDAGELRRILENANAHARCSGVAERSRAAGHG